MLAAFRGAGAATRSCAGRHPPHSHYLALIGPRAATCARSAPLWMRRVTPPSLAAPGATAAPPRRPYVYCAKMTRLPAGRPVSRRGTGRARSTGSTRRGVASTAERRGKDADRGHHGPEGHAGASSGGGGSRERVSFDSRLEYGSVLPRGVEDVEQFSLGIVSRFADRMMQSLKRPRPPTQFVAALGHAGSMIGLSAYFMSDMFYLRIMAMCGSFCGMLYHGLQPQPMWIPMAWGSLFVVTNAVMVYGIVQEQSEVSFQDWEMDFYDSYFLDHGVRPRQFQRLMAAGQWVDRGSGEVLVGPGGAQESDVVIMIQSGEAEVVINGKVVAHVGPGSFVGSAAGLFSGGSGSMRLPQRSRPAAVETALNEAEEEAAAEADFAAREVVAAVAAPDVAPTAASAASGPAAGDSAPAKGAPSAAFMSASRRAARLLAGRHSVHEGDHAASGASDRGHGPVTGNSGAGSDGADSTASAGRDDAAAPRGAATVGLADALDAAHSRVRHRLGRLSGASSHGVGEGVIASGKERQPGAERGAAVVGPASTAGATAVERKPPLVGVGPLHSDSLHRHLRASTAARAHHSAAERPAVDAKGPVGAAGAAGKAAVEAEGDDAAASTGAAPGHGHSSRLVRTKTPCRYVVWRVGDLQHHLEAEKGMALPMSALVTRDLKQKLAQVESQLFLATYREIVRAVVADGYVSSRQREVLREFRERHDIKHEWHQDVLAEFGWTRAEFDSGKRGSPRISLGGVAGAVSQVSRDLGSWLQSGSLFDVGSGLWEGSKAASGSDDAAAESGSGTRRAGGGRSNGSYEEYPVGEHEEVYESGHEEEEEEEEEEDPYAALTHNTARHRYTLYTRPYGARTVPAGGGDTGAVSGAVQDSAGSDADGAAARLERRHHYMSALSSADDAMHTAGVDGSALLRSLLRHNERLRLEQRAVEDVAAAAAQAHLRQGPPAVPVTGLRVGGELAAAAEVEGGGEEEEEEEEEDGDGGEDVLFILDDDDQL